MSANGEQLSDRASPELAAAFAPFSSSVEAAWQRSFMSTFPDRITRAFLARARETRVERGGIFYRGAHHDQMALLALVADGLIRIYLQAESGRRVTMHYDHPGAVIGAPALLLGGARHESRQALGRWLMLGGRKVFGEALRETVLLTLSAPQFLETVRTEASVAWPVATYLARRAVSSQQILIDDIFLSVRCRVARHILELAVPENGHLVVDTGHQEIADAIGSVREVVSRTLGELRDGGLIGRQGNRIIITHIEELRLVAAGE